MSRPDDIVIVGAGQAAVQVACSLRDAGHQGTITMLGEEPVQPYQRPPLSKAYLGGDGGADGIAFRAETFWAEQRIDLILGETVTQVVRGEGNSGHVVTAAGRLVPFDRLVLATGSTPRRLAVPGGDAEGCLVLRTLADAEQLRTRLREASDLVVVGGGFIGLEVAATAAASGVRVTVLESGARILGRAVSEATATFLADHHGRAGIEVRAGAQVTAVATDGNAVTGVVTAEDTVLAQLVLVGVGADPRTELAEAIGLETAGGIVVDQHALASDGTTVAVGDCTVIADPTPWADDMARVRLESVDHAVEQAATAVRTLLGEAVPHSSVPWFWSDQGKAKLQIVGLRRPTDTATVRATTEGRHLVGFHRDHRLVAAEVVNSPADFMALRKLLAAGHPVPPEIFADDEVDLRRLAKEARGFAVSSTSRTS